MFVYKRKQTHRVHRARLRREMEGCIALLQMETIKYWTMLKKEFGEKVTMVRVRYVVVRLVSLCNWLNGHESLHRLVYVRHDVWYLLTWHACIHCFSLSTALICMHDNSPHFVPLAEVSTGRKKLLNHSKAIFVYRPVKRRVTPLHAHSSKGSMNITLRPDWLLLKLKLIRSGAAAFAIYTEGV